MSKTPAIPVPRHEVEDPPPVITSREEEQEIMSLTAQEISSISKGLFGMTSLLETRTNDRNDEERITSALMQLDLALSRAPDEEMQSFLAAKKQCPELVNDAHRASFLWREDFDVKHASRRIVRYWERRRELFGAEKFLLPLTLRAAMRDDLDNLCQGFASALPVKDVHGRGILSLNAALIDWGSCTTESMQRTFWYLFELLAADPDVQKNGVVVLRYFRNMSFNNFNPSFARSITKMEELYLPVKIKAFHLCSPPPFLHIFLPIGKHLLGERLRKRLVVHYGSEKDCLSSLLKYGLPPDRVPTQMGGQLVVDHAAWLVAQFKRENHSFGAKLCEYLDTSSETLPLPTNGSCLTASHTSQNVSKQETHNDARSGHRVTIRGTLTNCYASALHNNSECFAAPAMSEPALQMPFDEVEYERSLVRMKSRPVNDSDEIITQQAESTESGPNACHVVDVCENRGDPRTNRALDALLTDPNLSLLEALLLGGFKFPNVDQPGITDQQIFDSDNVSLKQRKNQLSRRRRRVLPAYQGKRGDPRMNKAVAAKLENPQISLLDALLVGGFEFPELYKPGITVAAVIDAENVSLGQRKNQLLRRLRKEKNGEQAK